MKQTAVVTNDLSKTCFASISNNLISSLNYDTSLQGMPLLKLTTDTRVNYISAIVTTSHAIQEIKINSLYAHCLGLSIGSAVFVEVVQNLPPCLTANIEPVTVDDWEILELHSAQVESSLLDQIRVVWPGQVFPLWVDNGSVCVYMKTASINPENQPFAVLMPLTELIVAPKVHQPNIISPKSKTTPNRNLVGLSAKTIDEGNIPEVTTAQAIHKFVKLIMKSKFFVTIKIVMLYLPRVFIRFIIKCYQLLIYKKNKQNVLEDKNNVTQQKINSKNFDTSFIEELVGKSAPLKLDTLMRVEPVLGKDELRSSVPDPFLTKHHPGCIFLHLVDLQPNDGCEVILIEVTKIPSPAQKRSKDHKVKSVIVRMYIQPLSDLALPFDFSKNYQLKATSTLRRQLDISISSKVQLKKVNSNKLLFGKDVKAINFTLKRDKKSEQFFYSNKKKETMKSLITSFHNWLAAFSDAKNPLPVNIGTLIVFTNNQETVECTLTSVEPKLDKTLTLLISPELLDDVEISFTLADEKLKWPKESVDHLNLPKERVEDFIPAYKNEIEAMLNFADLALSSRPLAAYINQFGISPSRCMLVTGSKGFGKTSLCCALLNSFANDKLLNCNVTVVKCRNWVGKNHSSVQEKLNKCFEESVWRQPSVLLLDDLDILVPKPVGEDGESPEDFNNLKLASVVRKFLKDISNNNSVKRILVIVTSKSSELLHPLVAPQSTRLYGHILKLQLPDANKRVEIIKSLVSNLEGFDCMVDLEEVVSKTKGFAPVDLKKLVMKAHHTAKCRSLTSGQELNISTEDLESSINSFTPSTLHNVKLHKPTKVEWNEIGGLKAVKDQLAEQLLWPLKYKHLFENVGVSTNSGKTFSLLFLLFRTYISFQLRKPKINYLFVKLGIEQVSRTVFVHTICLKSHIKY